MYLGLIVRITVISVSPIIIIPIIRVIIIVPVVIIIVGAVSYTHLDVYKRQIKTSHGLSIIS